MIATVHRNWEDARLRRFRTAVSLHSHTSCVAEPLGRTGVWWSPPPGPAEALDLERGQIEALGLRSLVSLTDHDSIEAPLSLSGVPVSVEWTVPFGGTEFHLGVHNLPPRRARERMVAMADFTVCPRQGELGGLLDWLAEDPATLIVFNHPLWDELQVGAARQERLAREFLGRYRPWIHALECNGLRPWDENRSAAALAPLPFVSGGDRHGMEPNAVLNLTGATTFAEFVDEVRGDGRSNILVMPQYRCPMPVRVARAVGDVALARTATIDMSQCVSYFRSFFFFPPRARLRPNAAAR